MNLQKGVLVCKAFVNVKFAGTVKIPGFDTFRVVNQERVDTILVTLRDIASIIRNPWADRIQDFKVFGLLRDC
jgi:hypothetical protein